MNVSRPRTASVCVPVYMKRGGPCDSASQTKRNSLRQNRGRSQKPHTFTKAIMLKPLSVLPTLRLLKCSQILSKETLQLLLTGKVTTEVYKSLEAFCLASFRMIRGEWGRMNSSRRQPFKRGNNWVQISFRYVFNHSMITDIVVCPRHFYSQALLICTHNCALCFTHSIALKWFFEPNHFVLKGHLANTDIKWSNKEVQWYLLWMGT